VFKATNTLWIERDENMLAILILLGIFFLLILINNATKSTPDSLGCVQQGIVAVVVLFIVVTCSSNQNSLQSQSTASRTQSKNIQETITAYATLAKDGTRAETIFDEDTPNIFVVGNFSNATVGRRLRAQWFIVSSRRLPSNTLLTEATTFSSGDSGFWFSGSRPKAGWAIGEYQVRISVDGTECSFVNFEVRPKVAFTPSWSPKSENQSQSLQDDYYNRMFDPNDGDDVRSRWNTND
jgi:hypothetical protein